MLLELSPAILTNLLSDPTQLEEAVFRSKAEYLKEHHPSSLPTREEIGEELFDSVASAYPSHASKITGKENIGR